jgi:hypothetical protein
VNVFVSWSGRVTRKIASEFSDFLKLVVQRADPWFSDKTPAGAEWSRAISEKLGDSKIGILLVTQDNKENPWLMFEAGAIAKGVPENRVCVLLVDLKNEDIKPPLSLFQTNPLDKEGVFRVLQTVNDALPEGRFSDDLLKRAMNAQWSDFDAKVKKILADEAPIERNKPRDQRDMIVEILETVRGFDSALRLAQAPAWSVMPGVGFVDSSGALSMGQPINWTPGGDLRMSAAGTTTTTAGGLLGALADLDKQKK